MIKRTKREREEKSERDRTYDLFKLKWIVYKWKEIQSRRSGNSSRPPTLRWLSFNDVTRLAAVIMNFSLLENVFFFSFYRSREKIVSELRPMIKSKRKRKKKTKKKEQSERSKIIMHYKRWLNKSFNYNIKD